MFSKDMWGFLPGPEGGLSMLGGGVKAAAAGTGLKAGMQSESAMLEEVRDLLGDATLRFVDSSSNCAAKSTLQHKS